MFRPTLILSLSLLVALILPGCHQRPQVNPSSANRTAIGDPDPHWVIQQPVRSKVALVFVHGITGDMIDTWKSSNGKLFWDLVNENDDLKGKADMFVYGFPSYLFKSGSFDIQEAANRLHERLEYHQVLKYPAVVFVAHSMGGLVVLRELLTHHEELAQVPLVFFYATPMEGSLIAAVGKEFSPDTALGQMTPAEGNAILQQLDSEWKSIPSERRPHVECAYEKQLIGPTKIVSWASSTRYCDGSTPAIEATHITIVKPDRPNADAIIYLANALNKFVLGTQLEPKLSTPDFTGSGTNRDFDLTSVFGKHPAELKNDGGSRLTFSFADNPDDLYLSPEEPSDIPAYGSRVMRIALLAGPISHKYTFTLRTNAGSDLHVTVHVPKPELLKAERTAVAVEMGKRINALLSDPNELKRLQQMSTDDDSAPAEILTIARDEVAHVNPELPEVTQWVLAADMLNSLNWPTLAVRALQHAERSSPMIASTPSVQFLSRVIATQSGDYKVFANSPMQANLQVSIEARADQPLLNVSAVETATELATRLKQVPALKVLGLSLEGDIATFKGNPSAAKVVFQEAKMIRPSPSISMRENAVESFNNVVAKNHDNSIAVDSAAERVRRTIGIPRL